MRRILGVPTSRIGPDEYLINDIIRKSDAFGAGFLNRIAVAMDRLPAARREAVAYLMSAHEMSERRACKATGFCRMTLRYRLMRTDDALLRERLRVLAHERRRFGYRRLHVLLA